MTIAVFFIVTVAALVTSAVAAQTPIDVRELSDYQLTTETFAQFVDASGRIADVTRQDRTFTFAPLFTKDLLLSGDAVDAAQGLAARLANHAGLSAALEMAKMTPREYAKFAIALIAAHLANGFLKTGALQRVPPGAPTINVEFVKMHESEVTATLAQLGIRD